MIGKIAAVLLVIVVCIGTATALPKLLDTQAPWPVWSGVLIWTMLCAPVIIIAFELSGFGRRPKP